MYERNYIFKYRRTKVVAASLAVGISISVLAGCSASTGTTTPPSQTQEAEAPSTSSTTAQAPDPLQIERDQIRADIDRLTDMSWEEYKTLDRNEHLTYIGSILRSQYNDGEYYIDMKNPLDFASPNNDGQSIMDQHLYLNQLVMAQRAGDGTTIALDKEKAQKALAGGWYYAGEETMVAASYGALWDLIQANNDVAHISNRFEATESTELTNGTDRDGNAVLYKDIAYTGEQGDSNISRFIYSTFKDKNAETKGVWQLVANKFSDTDVDLDDYM